MKYLSITLLLFSVSSLYGQSLEETEKQAELHTKIDVHFNFENAEWSEVDKYWKFKLNQGWFTPHSKWVQETPRFKKISPKSQAKVLEQMEDIDRRVEALKDGVHVFVHSDERMPYMAFCVLPRGYKLSGYSLWQKLPRNMVPTLSFFPDFIEFLYRDYNKDPTRIKWLREMRNQDQAHSSREYRKAKYHSVVWTKKQKGIMYANWIQLGAESKFYVSEYTPGDSFDTESYYLDLKITGYTPSPAVAWRAPPVVPENPLETGLGLMKIGDKSGR